MAPFDPDEGALGYGDELPEPARQLKALCAAATIAHEVAFELHRKLSARSTRRPNERDQLLSESARIATAEIPSASEKAWGVFSEWKEQAVLDPGGSAALLRDLASVVEECAPTLRELLDHQKEIVQALQDCLDA